MYPILSMGKIGKTFALLLSLIIAMSCLIIIDTIPMGLAQSSTNVGGIIDSNTSWTPTNSPYSLTGNILVNNGVTLTIQPKVVVNLNGYYIMVNGTLQARGNENEKVFFNGGEITFTQYCNGWNQETQTGSIIENASVSGLTNLGGGIIIQGGSPAIRNSNLNVTIGIGGGSPIISGNTLTGVRYSNRFMSEGIYINTDSTSTPIITDNVLSGGFDDSCISIGSGSPIIQRNLLRDGTVGIDMMYLSSSSKTVVQNNTIANCFRGISIGDSPTLSFNYNNLEDISNFTVYSWRTTQNLNATYNWWGTTNTLTIDQKILDFNDDFNLGKVNYNPFLTAPNSRATPSPSPSTLPTPSPTPTVPELSWSAIVPLLGVLFFVAVVLSHRKTINQA
jgi:parallel beta-helix repeat protein